MFDSQKQITLSRRSGQTMDFVIRRCTEEDLEDILNLQLKVYEDLCDPGLYALVSGEDIHESLISDYCYGTYHDGRLVGFTMMIANRVSHRNYGSYIGYDPARQEKCVSLEISLVDREYRGFGLQKRYVSIREEAAVEHGAEEALVTIAPDNEYSLNNLLESGYEIVDTRPLYEGAMRHILSKRLQ